MTYTSELVQAKREIQELGHRLAEVVRAAGYNPELEGELDTLRELLEYLERGLQVAEWLRRGEKWAREIQELGHQLTEVVRATGYNSELEGELDTLRELLEHLERGLQVAEWLRRGWAREDRRGTCDR